MKKKVLIPLFLCMAVVSGWTQGPILVNLVPILNLPGISTTSLADSTQGYYMTGTATRASDYKRGSLYNLRRFIASKTQDSIVANRARIGGRLVDSAQVLDTALTGYATVITDTLRCGADVFGVTCNLVAGISGTSNGTAFTIGHIPLALRPSHTQTVPIVSVTDTGYVSAGYVSIASTGIVTVGKYAETTRSPTATFTASGTKAIAAGTSFRYSRF